MRIPSGAKIIGQCTHPRDGQHGTAIRLASGNEVLWDGTGAIRSLPANWRDHQPDHDALARILAATAIKANHPQAQ